MSTRLALQILVILTINVATITIIDAHGISLTSGLMINYEKDLRNFLDEIKNLDLNPSRNHYVEYVYGHPPQKQVKAKWDDNRPQTLKLYCGRDPMEADVYCCNMYKGATVLFDAKLDCIEPNARLMVVGSKKDLTGRKRVDENTEVKDMKFKQVARPSPQLLQKYLDRYAAMLHSSPSSGGHPQHLRR